MNLVLLGLLTAAITALLWPHWRNDADLSHGFLTLPLFLFLLHESRSGPLRFVQRRARTSVSVALLVTLGLSALCAAGLYAAALDWSHALVAFTLTLAVVLLLGAGLVAFATAGVDLVPLNWTSAVAVGLWLLSAPIPPGSYTRLTIALQLMLSENVLRVLHLLGIAALRQGNIIQLTSATVGIEEACSGVRSLVACIYAAFFFTAILVQRPLRRVVVIALSVPLAMVMNFLRSLILTLLASHGVDIAGLWHDLTGFAVLGITAMLLGGLAFALESGSHRVPAASPPHAPVRRPAQSSPGQRLLFAGLAGALVLAVFFFANTHPPVRRGMPAPDLSAMLPAKVPGWRVKTADDLYRFRDTLETDILAQRTYVREKAGRIEQITIYLAYWRPGQAPVSLVAMHTPDACWPGSGWTAVAKSPPREALGLPTRKLPVAEARFFTNGGYPQYVWFWHLYDGRPIAYRDPYSAVALLKIAWRYGFTHDGDQLFVRVSSNLPWPAIGAEPPITEFFARVRPLGL